MIHQKVTFANTAQFMLLALDSQSRNQGPTDALIKALDPEGNHLLAFSFVHNDVELRGMWLCKLKDVDVPVRLLMDNSFEAVEQYTQTQDVEDVVDEEAK